MVIENHRKKKAAGVIITALAIAAVAMLLGAAGQPAMKGQQIEGMTASATPIQNGIVPTPLMITNATISEHYNGWSPLEYNNGTANLTLPAQEYGNNPITLNPALIKSPELQGNDINPGTPWDKGAANQTTTLAGGSVWTLTEGTGEITLKANSSNAGNEYTYFNVFNINTTSLPSNNPSYDWITIQATFTGSDLTGLTKQIIIDNATSNPYTAGSYIAINAPDGSSIITFSLQQMIQNAGSNQNFNLSKNTHYQVYMYMNIPAAASTEEYMSITGASVSEIPYTIGTIDKNGSYITPNQVNASQPIATFSPDFPWTEVPNFNVSIEQSMQKEIVSNAAINSQDYSEQATYQGYFELPNAPDTSYGTSTVQMNMTIPGKQFIVAQMNGASYLTLIQAKNNGTFTFGTVNPITQNTMILEVDYTTSQWNSVSNPPSFWTNPIKTIEYYWYLAIGAALALIGLGAGYASHSESLRTGKR